MGPRTVWVAGVTVGLILAGCVANPGASAPPASTVSPSQAVATSSLTASDADVELSVAFDHPSVDAGGSVTATVDIANKSSRPITYQTNGCGLPASLQLMVPVPNGSNGSAQSGANDAFKQYALNQGLGQGGQPALAAVQETFGPVCRNPISDEVVDPGKSVTGAAIWTADVIPGVLEPAGTVAVTATMRYDPATQPGTGSAASSSPNMSPGALQPPPPMRIEQYQHEVTATGVLEIIDNGTGPKVLSAREAIDASLKSSAFDDWLSGQPSSSWVNANLYLDKRGWHVELFVNPRAFGMVLLDPVTGSVRSVNICAAPTCNQ
jgi:hypothetical protein